MAKGRSIILPDDPEWHQPFIMGDAYNDPRSMPPKLASQYRIQQLDAERATNNQPLFPYYDPNFKYASSAIAHAPDPWIKFAQSTGVSNLMTQPMWFSPLHTPQNWQIASRRREIYQWCRFFYENEPKVGAAIDFYSKFPMNGFILECPDRKVLKYFEYKVAPRLRLNENFKMISSEHFMLGDVFIHSDIQCPVCNGSAYDSNTGEMCNHPNGTIKKLVILNPDWIEVQQSFMADEPAIAMVPDEELKRIVFYKQPKVIYDRIPDYVKMLVLQNKPIPLSNRTTSHIKHMPVPYGSYGTSLIRRLFTTLAYKTKIMTANWIVAERLIVPVRVVKIGSDNRPATSADIADIQQQLGATNNDPNLTIVTHHNFEYEWYGATGKILQVTQEMEYIGKEILDGFMLNQALLNGEMGGYNSAQVGVETLIRRIESWRHTLAEWAEENLFKPIAEMQGFIDEKTSEEINERVYQYPTIKWNDLQLKDKNQWYDKLMQLHDKQVISTQTLMEQMDLDYDQEVKRKRYEMMQMGPAMGAMGMGGAGGGMGGMGGGGAPGMGGPEGGMGGDMGGGMGGMPGMPGMGAPGGDMGGGGAPGGGGMAPAAAGGKVMKKGKGGEQKASPEQMAAMHPAIQLTKIEQSMAGILTEVLASMGGNPNQLIKAQYPVQNPKGGKPFALDFAIPPIKLCIECDGEIWHGQPEQEMKDQERDNLLAQRGWSVLRFDDKAIQDSPQAVKQVVSSYVQLLMKGPKKQASTQKENKIFLFSSNNDELTYYKQDYEKYFGGMEIYQSKQIGKPSSPDNWKKASQVFKQ